MESRQFSIVIWLNWRFYVGPPSLSIGIWFLFGFINCQELTAGWPWFSAGEQGRCDWVLAWSGFFMKVVLMLDGLRADKIHTKKMIRCNERWHSEAHGRVEYIEKSPHEVSQSDWRSVFRESTNGLKMGRLHCLKKSQWNLIWHQGSWPVRSKAFLRLFPPFTILGSGKERRDSGSKIVMTGQHRSDPRLLFSYHAHRNSFYWSRPGSPCRDLWGGWVVAPVIIRRNSFSSWDTASANIE